MTSRTPIRLTPHRGPLATPSTSPESSPTLSTPPSDISYYSTAVSPSLDVTTLQHRISTLNLRTQDRCLFRLYHHGPTEGPLDRGTRLRFIFENLTNSACDLMNALARIVTFCLLVWGLLEWSSYAPSRQLDLRISVPHLPLLPRARTLPLHPNLSFHEPRQQHVAILQFLSEQIQHAMALSSLSISLGLPLRAFFEAHRATIPRAVARKSHHESSHIQDFDILANLTEALHPSVIDFTPGGFIGKSFAFALDDLESLISESTSSHGSLHGDARLHAIYWRTTSNLLLEYSSAHPRARKLLQHVHALYKQLSPIVSGQHAAGNTAGRLDILRRNGTFRQPGTTIDDGMQAFVSGLEVTLDNLQRLIAYLDWITEHLAQTTLSDILGKRSTTDFSSCLKSLQEMFSRSRSSTPEKLCFCWDDQGALLPRKVDVMVPGSPTVRAGF